MDLSVHLEHILLTVIYSVIGMGVFATAFLIIRMATPFSLQKEIEEDQNTALAILIGSMFIGLAIIIAASIAS